MFAHAQAGRQAGGSQDNCSKQAFASIPSVLKPTRASGDESTVAQKQKYRSANRSVGQQLVYLAALCAGFHSTSLLSLVNVSQGLSKSYVPFFPSFIN